jgi:hypothetical protein
MHPEVGELSMRGQPVKDQVARRPGHHHLAAMGDRTQPSTAVDRLTRVVLLVEPLDLRGLHGNAQPLRPPSGQLTQ